MVSSLVDRELRGALLICFYSLVGRSLLFRDQELVSITEIFGLVMMSSPANEESIGGGIRIGVGISVFHVFIRV